MLRLMLALCIAGASLSSAFAQSKIKPPKLAPQTDITTLAHAKFLLIDDESVVRFAFPKWKVTWKTETTEEEVLVEKIEKKVVNGKTVEVKTQVPERRPEVRYIPVLNPDGMAKSDIPLEDIKAWDLAGKSLGPDELKTRLKDVKPALMFEDAPEDGSSPLDPYYAAVFRADMIVVYSEQLIEDFEASTPFPPIPDSDEAPTPPAPASAEAAPAPPKPEAASQTTRSVRA